MKKKPYNYIQKTGNISMPSGLHLFPSGHLWCSPDGIIVHSSADTCGALEIKCPRKYRDATIQEMIKKEKTLDKDLNSFYFTETLNVNPQHDYWHQLLAEMAVIGATWAHFVIWTKKRFSYLMSTKMYIERKISQSFHNVI